MFTAGASADVTDRLRQVVPRAAGAMLDVEVAIGDVRVVGAPRDDVAVEIVRVAPTAADLGRFPVEIGDAARRRVRVRQAGSDPRLKATVHLEVPRRARTFNGDLRLAFAARPTDARIMALALNGTVRSDIPLTLRTGWGPRWGETTLGRGEPVVSLDVVTGDIRIEAPGPRRS
jgi:hypothetical protein